MCQHRTGFLGCVHLGTQGWGLPCQHEPLWPLNSPCHWPLGNHKALPFAGAWMSWTNCKGPMSRWRLETVPNKSSKASKWVQKSGHPTPRIRETRWHKGTQANQQSKQLNHNNNQQNLTLQWPEHQEQAPKAIRNAKCLNENCQSEQSSITGSLRVWQP